jgi:hypothetical protein
VTLPVVFRDAAAAGSRLEGGAASELGMPCAPLPGVPRTALSCARWWSCGDLASTWRRSPLGRRRRTRSCAKPTGANNATRVCWCRRPQSSVRRLGPASGADRAPLGGTGSAPDPRLRMLEHQAEPGIGLHPLTRTSPTCWPPSTWVTAPDSATRAPTTPAGAFGNEIGTHPAVRRRPSRPAAAAEGGPSENRAVGASLAWRRARRTRLRWRSSTA